MTETPRLPIRIAALVGVLALAVALAAGQLVAAAVGPGASPLLAVGNTTIDLAPPWVKEFAIDTFGTNDKLALLLGMGIVLLLIGAGAGLVARRVAWPGVAVTVVVGGLGIAAVYSRPDLGQLAVLAPLASLLAGVLAFRWLHSLALNREQDTDGLSRRAFLRGAAGVAAGAGVAGFAGLLLSNRVDVEGSRAAVGKLNPKAPAPPAPAGADFAAKGSPTFITSNADFYRIDTALTVPRLRAEDWRLRIHGMVDRERTYSYADIRARELVERPATLVCVSNDVGGPLISTALFTGVPVRDLLLEAGVRPGADQVLSTSHDSFTAGTPTEALLDEHRGALLAIGMNGEPLPLEHGFPARLVVPGLYGYVSATKWVVDLELTTFAAKQGYWVPRGWAAKAPIKTQSRIDSPSDGATVAAGQHTVTGIAWAPTIGIDRVEVRVDGGQWQEAQLSAEVSTNTWRMWLATVDLPRGGHRIAVRATDRTGYTQTERTASPAPDGATGWHSVTVTAR